MYEAVFYRDKNGKEPVNEHPQKLARPKRKDSRIKLNKIQDYVKALSLYGATVGEPYMMIKCSRRWVKRSALSRCRRIENTGSWQLVVLRA
jgi:phage-related protein